MRKVEWNYSVILLYLQTFCLKIYRMKYYNSQTINVNSQINQDICRSIIANKTRWYNDGSRNLFKTMIKCFPRAKKATKKTCVTYPVTCNDVCQLSRNQYLKGIDRASDSVIFVIFFSSKECVALNSFLVQIIIHI